MIVFSENNVFEIDNIISFRDTIPDSRVEEVIDDMKKCIIKNGARIVGKPITATYAAKDGFSDIEILIPIDKSIGVIDKYAYKSKLRIANALKASYRGNPSGINEVGISLNQYILNNQLMPITAGYNVMKEENVSDDDIMVDIYVGINPNIL